MNSRKLLIIDPHFVKRSPAMKNVFASFHELEKVYDEIEIWGIECEKSSDKLTFSQTWCPFKLWFLQSIWYWFHIHIRYIWRFKIRNDQRPTVVQSTSFYCIWADIIYIHFVFHAFRGIVKEKKGVIVQGLKEKLGMNIACIQEMFLWKFCKAKHWWVVSKSLADYVESRLPSDAIVNVLPNSYDPQRFNLEVRDRQREKMRSQLGFDDDTLVFCFVGLGDFERKGFGLALKIVEGLSKKNIDCKLLVVGGRSETPSDFSPYYQRHGIHDDSFVVKTGRVPDVENYFAASDAFLFPSFCEAFALVEIEASAMGLRLYLTHHYGSEMILKEGVNGRFLDWDSDRSISIVEEDIANGGILNSKIHMGEALTPSEFASCLIQYHERALKDLLNT